MKNEDLSDVWLLEPQAGKRNVELALPSEKETDPVNVTVWSFEELLANASYPLALDSYQRPYVWGTEKVKQLLEDLADYLDNIKQAEVPLSYYMGTLLLHHHVEKERLFVIDGQQRLTSLCILYYILYGTLPLNQAMDYNSPLSEVNIHQTQQVIQNYFEKSDNGQSWSELFAHICFTVIEVNSADLAFTFFDTQNNRGIPLQATDLLKAYHLRAIQGKNYIELQTESAERWEKIQGSPQILGYESDFAPALFHHFLWRARRWTGQKLIARETYDDILDEFQYGAISPPSPDTVELYATRSNRWGISLSLLPQNGYSIQPKSIHWTHHPAGLPFAIRQPVSKGIGFFLFADKYNALLRELLNLDNPEPEVKAFRNLYQQVVTHLSNYLQELFFLASVMYVDQFRYQQLFHFALWLEHTLGAIRLEKHYIFKQAPIIYLRDSSQNLLDIIANSFRPKEVIDFLKSDEASHKVYDSSKVDEIEQGKGVRGCYKQRVLTYYSLDEFDIKSSLRGKSGWITESFLEAKLS